MLMGEAQAMHPQDADRIALRCQTHGCAQVIAYGYIDGTVQPVVADFLLC